MTYTNLEALKRFSEIPEVKNWNSGKATENKQSTRREYMIFLMRFLAEESPADFLKRCDKEPKAIAKEVKARLGELYEKSNTTAKLTKYALKSFLSYHDQEVPLNGKIKVRRVRKKPEMKWENAQKIIAESDEPYRSLFTFMLNAGLGEDEVMEIQGSPEIQHSIEDQRTNAYVKISLTPRKSNLDEFFTLVPSEYVPTFPVKTRGGALVDSHDMQSVWRRAAKKAKVYQVGLGPHQLRSAFRSQCGKADVANSVSEFFMGHGGGDKFGYSREALDEDYAAKEIGKLWTYNRAGSREAYSDLLTEVQQLREKITILEKEYKS